MKKTHCCGVKRKICWRYFNPFVDVKCLYMWRCSKCFRSSVLEEGEENLIERKSELKEELEIIEKKLKHSELPKHMRESFKLGFGWPRISQSLSLDNKLDKKTYDELYSEIEKLINEIADMVPDYADANKECWRCEKVKATLLDSMRRY